MQERREIDQVSRAIGALEGQFKALAATVGDTSAAVADISAQAAERKGMLEEMLRKLEELGGAVASLNDVDRKLLDVGLRADDAEAHRKDHLFLRRWRRQLEFVSRHTGKALVTAIAGTVAAWALSNYEAAAAFVRRAIGE